ncbi:MAG: CBS domain-containing protein [Candidatus Bathyarchaeia archaeon]
MMTRDLMLKDVVTTYGNVPAKEAIELLYKRHVGSIVVIDEAGHCIGIFTERDAIRVVAQNVPLDAPVEKIMTKNPFTINEDSIFEEAKSIIKSAKVRHLPVIDTNGKLVGLISVRHILDELSGL